MLRFIFLGIWVFLASCLSPESSVCSDGSVCPSVLVCQEEGSCVDRGQLAACTGLMENAKCSTTVAEGLCIDGLCVSENCGDGLLTKGEACDDGNAVGGDGCSARCDKIEICGDSIIDEGEACDDGNVTPVDGCDACVETVWQARTIIAAEEENALARPRGIAFDVAGNLYIADRSNFRIRRLDAKSGKLTTIAGTGKHGLPGDGGKATSAGLNSLSLNPTILIVS